MMNSSWNMGSDVVEHLLCNGHEEQVVTLWKKLKTHSIVFDIVSEWFTCSYWRGNHELERWNRFLALCGFKDEQEAGVTCTMLALSVSESLALHIINQMAEREERQRRAHSVVINDIKMLKAHDDGNTDEGDVPWQQRDTPSNHNNNCIESSVPPSHADAQTQFVARDSLHNSDSGQVSRVFTHTSSHCSNVGTNGLL